MMCKAIRQWWHGFITTRDAVADLRERIARLTASVELAESWITEFRVTRVLFSGGNVLQVTGTELDVRRAASAMAIHTKSRVTIAAIVGRYPEET